MKPQLCELDFLGKSAISQDFTGIQLLSHFSPLNCAEAQNIFIIELSFLQQQFLQPQRLNFVSNSYRRTKRIQSLPNYLSPGACLQSTFLKGLIFLFCIYSASLTFR